MKSPASKFLSPIDKFIAVKLLIAHLEATFYFFSSNHWQLKLMLKKPTVVEISN